MLTFYDCVVTQVVNPLRCLSNCEAIKKTESIFFSLQGDKVTTVSPDPRASPLLSNILVGL